jgi:branched-chain amino acid transport system permease protein
MESIFGVPVPALAGQLILGLVNGCFYAILSLGLAVIFGLLNVVNFAHGAMYMLGAYGAYVLLTHAGASYWTSLVVVPIVVGLFGVLLERVFLKWLYKLDHIYGLLATFGMATIIEGLMRAQFGVSGQRYAVPGTLAGATDIGFMMVPTYRLWVVAMSLIACTAVWLLIEKTRIGATLRAGTENARIVAAFGVNVPRMVMVTFGVGVGLAAFAGVMAAPIVQINPLIGSSLTITVFAVVVIGGMGSIGGSIITGLALGVIEGMTKVFYPEAATTVVFLLMVVVLLVRPAGLFGK